MQLLGYFRFSSNEYFIVTFAYENICEYQMYFQKYKILAKTINMR